MFFFPLINFLFSVLFFAFVAFMIYKVAKGDFNKTPVAMNYPKGFLWVIAAALLGYNLFAHELVFMNDFVAGLGIGLFSLAIFGALPLAFPSKKRGVWVYFLASLGALAGLGFGFRANEFVHAVNFVVMFVSFVGLMGLYVFEDAKWEGVWFLRAGWSWLMRSYSHSFDLIASTFHPSRKSKAVRVLKTALITLVVLVFFLALLSQADPVFDKLIENFRNELFLRTIVSLLIATVLTFFLSMRVEVKNDGKRSFQLFGYYDFVVPAAALTVIFAVFLFVQAKYLFGTQADFQALGITYSDYVRKGFVELLFVCLAGGVLSHFLIQKADSENKNRKYLLQGVNFVLVLELFAMLGSALKRDLMYIDTYGMTRMRIVGAVFLAWLAIFLLMLFVRTVWIYKEKWVWKGMVLASTVAFLYFNVVNMDQMLVEADSPEGMSKDYFYLANLSEDAVLGWEAGIEKTRDYFNSLVGKTALSKEQMMRLGELKMATRILQDKRDELRKITEENPGFVFWNYSRENALLLMDEKSELFDETLDCLTREIVDYQLTYAVDMIDEEMNRLYGYEELLVNVRSKYRSYPQNLGGLLGELSEENDEYLKKKLIEAYGERNYYSHLRLDEPIVRENIEQNHVPEACGA